MSRFYRTFTAVAVTAAFALGGCSRSEEEHYPLSMYGRVDDPFIGPRIYYTVPRGELPLAYQKTRVSWTGKRTIIEERHYYLAQDVLEKMWELSDGSRNSFIVRSTKDAKANRLRPCTPSERPNWPYLSKDAIVWCAYDGDKVA